MVNDMATINVLDDSTINKIAAGEVVERPVSVVKELVENAIDSGAKNISIEIKGGGIDYIRVSDNGSGIERSSIPTAFLRHATSKIRSIEDLINTTSLGFRGEALSSIASVSQVELLTKTKEDLLGYRYTIHGGKEMSFDEAGLPDGTTVIVRNLFYNTPARRKFLKSAMTEGNYITELVEKMILSHPDISFKYVLNGAVKLTGNGLCDTQSDVYTIFGRDMQRSLVEISYDTGDFTIKGFVGKPETARGNRNFELFFVNNRCVKNKVLSSAVEEAYKPYLMLHKFPFVILYIDIQPELLDVNVHPAKTEIRFLNERDIYSAVFEAATDGITRKELIPEVVSDHKDEDVIRPLAKDEASVFPEPFETARIPVAKSIAKQSFREVKESIKPVQETLFKEGLLGEENRNRHRIIGQVFDTYWIIEYEDKMYIIDQHAAHEKVLYERFSKQIAASDVTSQMISPPIIVSLTLTEEETVRQHIELFREIGFEIEHFGGRDYALSAVPAELFRMNENDYFLSIVDDLADNPKITEPKQVKDRIATMACKAAVKGNMRMSYAEADALIEELLLLDNPYNCPHGRPTIISYTRSELEKLFKRIV